MKNKALRTVLYMFLMVIVCIWMVVLYLVYVPLAMVRVFVDKDGYMDFVDCVGTCVKTMVGWFRKSEK